jgi:hypothetical protein
VKHWFGSVHFWTDGHHSCTTFADGTRVPAAPQDNAEYRYRAALLGYGGDTGKLSAVHEFTHSFLAARMGLPVSPVLWAVAHGEPRLANADEEEAVVLAFQAFLNGGRAAPVLVELGDEERLRMLRCEALTLLRPDDA